MSESVFILGAGASREAGAPIMMEFLDAVDSLMKDSSGRFFSNEYQLLRKARGRLAAAHSKAQLDLDNLESLFGAFEIARLTGRLDGFSSQEVEQLSPALKKIIAGTLARRIQFPVERNSHGTKIAAPKAYEDFVELIAEAGNSGANKVSVLTFNYDLCLDFALHRHGIDYTYALDGSADEGGLKLLKLHGSLNWGTCPDCNMPIALRMGDYFQRRPWSISGASHVALDFMDYLRQQKHCGKNSFTEPLLIPPTWNKTDYHKQIDAVWQAAAHELSEAENIYIFGYSLPPTDSFFRFLYALGTISDVNIKRFWVFDPDTKGQVEERYRALLGQAVQPRFQFFNTIFSGAITSLQSQFPKPEPPRPPNSRPEWM